MQQTTRACQIQLNQSAIAAAAADATTKKQSGSKQQQQHLMQLQAAMTQVEAMRYAVPAAEVANRISADLTKRMWLIKVQQLI
jgi:hypothetical protein